jgi:hypothetical protein
MFRHAAGACHIAAIAISPRRHFRFSAIIRC